jgi:hypothetical protein
MAQKEENGPKQDAHTTNFLAQLNSHYASMERANDGLLRANVQRDIANQVQHPADADDEPEEEFGFGGDTTIVSDVRSLFSPDSITIVNSQNNRISGNQSAKKPHSNVQ